MRREREALLGERNHRKEIGLIWRGAEHPRSGPGSFAARLLPVEDGDANIIASEFEGDRSANDSAADNDDVVRSHADILAAKGNYGGLALRSNEIGQLRNRERIVPFAFASSFRYPCRLIHFGMLRCAQHDDIFMVPILLPAVIPKLADEMRSCD